MTQQNQTPMMSQWASCKQRAGNALLLFRMGDFYESFHEDAETLAKELEVALTKRQGTPMAGIPWMSIDSAIDKLVSKGLHVAIAEQTESPKEAKGLVNREVTRIVTPGTLVGSQLLDQKSANYFACLCRQGDRFAFACVDLSTADCRVCECESERELLSECVRRRPAEILTSRRFAEEHRHLLNALKEHHTYLLNTCEEWRFDPRSTQGFLLNHLKVATLEGYGLHNHTLAMCAAGGLLAFLQDQLAQPISQIQELQFEKRSESLELDFQTQRHLELLYPSRATHRHTTLFAQLDSTLTPMGSRLLQRWIAQPLNGVSEIQRRQEAVSALLEGEGRRLDPLRQNLRGISDLERLVTKIIRQLGGPRDLIMLAHSIAPIEAIKGDLAGTDSQLVDHLNDQLKTHSELHKLIQSTLIEEPPARIGEGKSIREGVNEELDELRNLQQQGREWVEQYQAQLREITGIRTLKVGHTRAFGYYIEISKAQAASANLPDAFQRRQTLVNGERFTTAELHDYQTRIESSAERIAQIEAEIFTSLIQCVVDKTQALLMTAAALAQLDTLQSFAFTALERRYIRPTVDDSGELHIEEGRHPVIENLLQGEPFVPNSVQFDAATRLMVITGPNMAGKSTYMRQIALIVIMAQMGAFVPARSARIGVVDRLFTRIGAHDHLAAGQSTFMVEMVETAAILHQATERSLIVLDEIGRGTSTHDGVAIAWAVAEHLIKNQGRSPRTLFATHYFELTDLASYSQHCKNYSVATQECDGTILFLHQIAEGAADKSYGVHVASLAGLPKEVVERAGDLLRVLESQGVKLDDGERGRGAVTPQPLVKAGRSQKEGESLFTMPPRDERSTRIAKELRKIEIDHLTPLQAQLKLAELIAIAKRG